VPLAGEIVKFRLPDDPVVDAEMLPSEDVEDVGFTPLAEIVRAHGVGEGVGFEHAIVQRPPESVKPDGHDWVDAVVVGPDCFEQFPPNEVQSEPPSQVRGVESVALT
jgi:hypothetical protein